MMMRRIKRNRVPPAEADENDDHQQGKTSTGINASKSKSTNRNNRLLGMNLSSKSTSSRANIIWSFMLLAFVAFALNTYFKMTNISLSHKGRAEVGIESQENINSRTDEQNEPTGTKHLESSTTSLSTSSPQHVVFIGDSLLRYSYLEWLHHQHYHSPAPESLINEKLSESWYSYFQSSTAHFQGHMKCDCRRSQTFSLGKEVENRYYFRGGGHGRGSALAATYIQGYGDNQAHGRYAPHDLGNSTISTEDDTSGYKWGYMGQDWDNLIKEYVAKMEVTPTLMVFNAGFWPNEGIALNLGSILRSAKDAMGHHGRVIWKGITPTRGEPVHPSPADLAAKDWSYRYPWLSYQAFDTSLSINEEDYFDDKHFSKPQIYRGWNEDINLNQGIVHRVFILVGGVRTLRQTQKSILQNLIYPMCAPPSCIAHLVIHFSRADNRPGTKGEDPGGKVLAADSNDEADDFFASTDDLFPDGFLILHKVDGYEIGSAGEQRAMDVMESEIGDPEVVHRLRVIRFGDPRRYSMWFARAWAWRFCESLQIDFDFYVFCRPDMLWLLPAPTKSFFDDISLNKARDVFTHALYYTDVADTFAFLPSLASAKLYFSLHNLVREDVACLGGPALNQSVVEQVLTKKGIRVDQDMWCENESSGWSEKILYRKIEKSGANIRYIHASAVILRPPSVPECQCASTRYISGFARIPNSHVPMISCLMADRMIKKVRKARGEKWSNKCYLMCPNSVTITYLCCSYSHSNHLQRATTQVH